MFAMSMVFHMFSMAIPWKAVKYSELFCAALQVTSNSAAVLPQTSLHVEFTEVHGTPWRTHGFAVISVQFRGVTAQTVRCNLKFSWLSMGFYGNFMESHGIHYCVAFRGLSM